MPAETLEAPADTEQETLDAQFSDALKGAFERHENAPADDAEVDDIVGEEAAESDDKLTGEAEKPADAGTPEKQPEGLSAHLVRLAMKADIPQQFIDMARDDAQLSQYIEMLGAPAGRDDKSEELTPGQGLVKNLLLEAVIPEDDFDKNDPGHRAIAAITERLNLMAQALGKTFDATHKVDSTIKHDREFQTRMAEESDFDSGIDSLSLEGSKRGSADRQKSFPLFRALIASEPGTSRQELAIRAHYATHPDLLKKAAETKQLDAMTKQAGTKLGGGAAKPALPKKVSDEEAMRSDIGKFVERARLAGKK